MRQILNDKTQILVISLFLLLIGSSSYAQKTISKIDLSGEWYVKLGDNLDSLTNNLEWDKRVGGITLPGSLAKHQYGLKTKDFGTLTPTHKLIGIASYTRDLVVPKKWKNISEWQGKNNENP